MDTAATTEGPSAATGPVPGPGPTRRLSRSSDDRIVAGVAGGIAEHYGIEPLFVRLGFVAATFFGGIGVVAYLVAWIVLPVTTPTGEVPPRRVDTQQLLGFGLVAVGLAVIPGTFGFGIGGAIWPVALIAIGVAVLWLRTAGAPDAPPAPVQSAASAETHAPPPAPPPLAPPPPVAPPRVAPPPAVPPPAVPRPARPPRPKSYLGAITFSALLILAGGAWLVDLADLVDVDVAVVFALALAVVGVALVVSAWFGRARGLIAFAIVLSLATAALGVVDVPLRGGIGGPTYRPHALDAVDDKYELAIGELTLDLRDVDFAQHRRRVVSTVGIGELNVLVPIGVRVALEGHAGVGSVTAFGRRSQTCCPTDVHLVHPGIAGGGTLVLVAEVGTGTVEITD